jgi:hypothetical protein
MIFPDFIHNICKIEIAPLSILYLFFGCRKLKLPIKSILSVNYISPGMCIQGEELCS